MMVWSHTFVLHQVILISKYSYAPKHGLLFLDLRSSRSLCHPIETSQTHATCSNEDNRFFATLHYWKPCGISPYGTARAIRCHRRDFPEVIPFLNNVFSILFDPSQNQSLNEDIESAEHKIALDRTAPINHSAFHRVLTSVQYNLQRHIDNDDGVLQPQHNPYEYEIQGCQSTNFSPTGFGKLLLTYGMMKEVTYGLRVF